MLDKKLNQNFINSAEAAEFLNVSSRTLQRLRDYGRIKFYQDSRIIRYKIEDLEKYFEDYVMEPFDLKNGGRNG